VSDGRWRRIYSNSWHASAFQGLDDAQRVVYFYALTSPQSTSVGIYRISAAVAVEDMGGNLTAVEFDQRLDAVCEALSWRLDPYTRVLWIPTWLHENPPQSPNVCKSWRKLLGNLPDCDLKFEAAQAIFQSLKDFPQAFREAFGSLPKDFGISKSKPLAKPKAKPLESREQGNQGAAIRESETQRVGFGAEKNEANPSNGVSSRLVAIAKETLKLTDPSQSLDDLVEAFGNVASHEGLRTFSRADARQALNHVLRQAAVS
jgi:hypothetical protein